MGSLSTCGSKQQIAPIPRPLQNPANSPIISLPGLLQLAQWIQAYRPVTPGGDPCPNLPPPSSPPAPTGPVGSRPAVESADGRTAPASAGDSQQHRRSTTRRPSRRTGGARGAPLIPVAKVVTIGRHRPPRPPRPSGYDRRPRSATCI